MTPGLDGAEVQALVDAALAEDLAGGVDATSVATIPAEAVATGDFIARADGVVAGLAVAELVVRTLAPEASVHIHVADSTFVRRGEVLASVCAPARQLLTAERTALNLLCHLSGVATLTARWVAAVDGTGAMIRDTRKTTPLLRALEKYAVRCGGGTNHRMSLSDEALIKDNHVIAAGGVVPAFERVRAAFPDLAVQVEVTTVEQAVAVADAGAESILLDNMSTEAMAGAVTAVAGRARLEASGGLTLERAREVADTGVNYLAVGALTHSAPILDIALDLRTEQ